MSCVCGRQYRTVTPWFCIGVCVVAAQKSVRNAGAELWLHKNLSETLARNCGCTKSRQKLRQVIVAAQRLLYPKGESNPLWNNGVCGVGLLIVRGAIRDLPLGTVLVIVLNSTCIEDNWEECLYIIWCRIRWVNHFSRIGCTC